VSQQPPEPYWSPLARPQFSWLQQAGIVVRHLIPVAGTLWFGWSLSQFALLSIFNIAFSLGCIAFVGLGASTLKAAEENQTGFVDGIGAWLSLLAATTLVIVLFTGMFGWLVFVMAPEGAHLLSERSLWMAALTMIVAAAPAVAAQLRIDAHSNQTEEQRKQRDQPAAGVLFLSGIVVFAMSGYAAGLGAFGLYPLMFAITAFFIFRDLRPDLMREAMRPRGKLTEAQAQWSRKVRKLP
jgi:hypothetical protein